MNPLKRQSPIRSFSRFFVWVGVFLSLSLSGCSGGAKVNTGSGPLGLKRENGGSPHGGDVIYGAVYNKDGKPVMTLVLRGSAYWLVDQASGQEIPVHLLSSEPITNNVVYVVANMAGEILPYLITQSKSGIKFGCIPFPGSHWPKLRAFFGSESQQGKWPVEIRYDPDTPEQGEPVYTSVLADRRDMGDREFYRYNGQGRVNGFIADIAGTVCLLHLQLEGKGFIYIQGTVVSSPES